MHIGDCHCQEHFDITQDKLCDEAISLDSSQAPSHLFGTGPSTVLRTGFGMTPFVRLLRKTCLERIECARGKHFEAISFITVGARCSVPLRLFGDTLRIFAGFFIIPLTFFLMSCSGGSGGSSGGSAIQPEFENVIQEVGIGDVGNLGQTAAWGDFDGDGRQDLFVANTDSRPPNSFLFRNAGGSFVDVTMPAGIFDLPLRSAAWADYDNDGRLDLVVGTIEINEPPILYRNTDGSFFADVSVEAGITEEGGITSHTVWADYDNDGLVDLFQANIGVSFLYRNEGDGTFSEVSTESGLGEFLFTNSAIWFDFNNDGFSDLFLANDGINTFYSNNGDGTFTDVTDMAGLGGDPGWNSVSACVGDFNGDGFLDLYVGNISSSRNALYRNNGDGTFTDLTSETGTGDVGDARTCAWVDFDADGRIDLFTTNHTSPSKLFRNLGNIRFSDVAPQIGLDLPLDVFAAPWGDYNNDGFMDVFLNGHIGIALMESSGNSNNFIIIELIGDGVLTNTSAIGTRVRVSTPGRVSIREVSGGKGCCEQDMLPLHFGVGEATQADLRVDWSSGEVCSFTNLDVRGGRRFILFEDQCDLLDLN